MTSQGFERPAVAGPVDDQAEPEWDDPLTRLLLLLEIADEPPWLRQIERSPRSEEGRLGHRAG
ncbi:hypothetical protein ACWGJ2_33205 [Streptomyces sp. NPDC054796]